MIAVQFITIAWSKDHRGLADSERRNALPRLLPFHPPGNPAADWVQRAQFDAPDYAVCEQWAQRAPGADDPVAIRRRDDVAEILFTGVYIQKPRRPHFKGLIARLPFGQRLAILINTGSDWQAQRRYYEYAIHVGYAATATLDLPLFREIDERVVLY